MLRRALTRKRLLLTSAGSLTAGTGLYLYTARNDASLRPGEPSTGTLLRTWAVFTMCSVPALVDHSPRILEVLGKVPVVREVAEAFVRRTFFDQFVGGDTAHETLPVLRALRSANTGALFAYSVEVDEHEAHDSHLADSTSKADVSQRIVNEMIRCIDVADEFETRELGKEGQKKTWVAVKITALLPNAASLINLSKHLLATRPTPSPPVPFPGLPDPTDLDVLSTSPDGNTFLTAEDIKSLKRLYGDLDRICGHAERKGVKVIIDAEYSWYQPALDALTFALMRKYNAIKDEPTPGVTQPLIYATYQAYLRRTLPLLHHTLSHSRTHSYSLGIKLVRGAYHPTELTSHHRPLPPSPLIANPKDITLSVGPTEQVRDVHEEGPSISPDPEPPVWAEKRETDACYDACVRVLVGSVAADAADRKQGEGEGEGKGRQPGVGVLFGTHNWRSANLILEEAVRHGLAHYIREGEAGSDGTGNEERGTVTGSGGNGEGGGGGGNVVRLSEELTERVTVAQLYGMGDALSEYMTRRTRSGVPFVIRYVPYGALSEVMPYLGRRAIENKSMLGDGGASEERRRAGREMRRRMWGGDRNEA